MLVGWKGSAAGVATDNGWQSLSEAVHAHQEKGRRSGLMTGLLHRT